MTRADKPAIRATILSMIAERAEGKTVCPSEVARHIAGQDEKAWRLLMHPIRAESVALAQAGAITIYRKGQPVDPAAFKGIYRLGRPSGAGE
ncbi:DUF3253 domain-containing protein [Aureimonas frigidaquae]|uniref:DUF3253 domain-containing protein n=1 Tax=Aureimonas frigidaquae TaxID=424757 RepID=A0A0P0Z351_9HYPH|nr:DUF3253 domain-containing protein [Aureimonas frigidaquae]BAT28379.1 hypothetical protein [Aureimonas frigidaquae]